MSPVVSIVMPCFNGVKFMRESINSVIAQTFGDWELLIVDDCSTDDSFNIACAFAQKDVRIRVFKNETNCGSSFSRAKALDESKGEYIAFLDCDDVWLPQKLERQLAFMQENDCCFSFTEYEFIDAEGNFMGKIAKAKKTLTYHQFLFHNFVGCSSVMYLKKGVAEEIRPIGKTSLLDDYALFLQVLKKLKRAKGIQECLYKYRIHSAAISHNCAKKIKSFMRLFCKRLGFPVPVAFFFMCTNFLIGKTWKYKRLPVSSSTLL